MHICDNRKCINPSHLKVGTIADNNNDMAAKKRNRSGFRHHWTKISQDVVDKIKCLSKEGRTKKYISDLLSVKYQTVVSIANGECRK
jgi:hypothetical protein